MPETIYGLPSMVFIWGGMMVLFAIVGIAVSISKNSKYRNDKTNFLKKHPDASKIYEVVNGVIVSGGVEIHAIDGEVPVTFLETGKAGKYIAPGKHRIQISASHTRPGVVYKTVTKSTGTIDKMVDIEPNSSYELSYDRKTAEFSLEKV
jgi:hypothetical protein